MICGCYRQRLHRCIPVGTLGRGGGGRRRAETVIMFLFQLAAAVKSVESMSISTQRTTPNQLHSATLLCKVLQFLSTNCGAARAGDRSHRTSACISIRRRIIFC
jgi:hypothetical protein